ncbi:hypothetical protein ACFL5G_00185 [Candidatus Margulisiibacteriota bacterium]
MKKIVTALLVLSLLSSAALAIDGARGLGTREAKLEIDYTGGSAGVAYNYGLSVDWTIYGSVRGAGGVTGFGAGTKYAFMNEKKGDNISFAGKLDLLIGAGGIFPIPGLVVSKKIKRDLQLLGDASAWSAGGVSTSWIGGGVVYALDRKWQLAGLIGISNITTKQGYKASGVGVGLGINCAF